MTPERWSPAARAYASTQQAWRGGDKPRMRVGDADRQRVVAELQRHYVDGRLTSDELSDRVDQALAARTEADLAPLLADLPAAAEHGDPRRPHIFVRNGTRHLRWEFMLLDGDDRAAFASDPALAWALARFDSTVRRIRPQTSSSHEKSSPSMKSDCG